MQEQIKIRAIYPTAYSHIKAFEQCPKQFYHVKHLNEFPYVETPETKEGNEFHKAAELYIRDGTPLPERFLKNKPVLDALNAKPGKKFAELKMGITMQFVPCTFFSPEVWIRGIVDLLIIDGDKALIIDYKTGKSAKYAETDQLELMALLVFSHYPEVKSASCALVFTKANEMVKAKFDRSQRATLWSGWMKRYKQMKKAYSEKSWPTRESGLCKKHCPVVECLHNGANK